MIEEERCDVIVIDEEQNIGFLFRQPLADRLISLKDWRPIGIGLFVHIESKTDCGSMRTGDCTDYRGHEGLLR